MSVVELQFQAAVKVIRGLPKYGNYQPSNEMLLRFYAFYKQATAGPCAVSKPAFWEVVKKAKWEAWKALGSMTKEEAMQNYIEELKKIVETMSFNDEVAEFMDLLGPFYEEAEILDDGNEKTVNGDIYLKDNPLKIASLTTQGEDEDESDAKEDISIDGSVLDEKAIAELDEEVTTTIKNSEVITWSQSNGGDVHLYVNSTKFNGHSEDSHVEIDSEGEIYSDPAVQLQEIQIPFKITSSKTSIVKKPVPVDELYFWTLSPQNSLNGFSNNTSIPEKKPDTFSPLPNNPVGSPQRTVLSPNPRVARGGEDSDENTRDTGDRNQERNVASNFRRGNGEPRPRRRVSSQGSRQSGSGKGDDDKDNPNYTSVSLVNDQIAATLLKMQKDLENILGRLSALEALAITQNQALQAQQQLGRMHKKKSPWFSNLKWHTILFMVAWPIVVNFIIRYIARRRWVKVKK